MSLYFGNEIAESNVIIQNCQELDIKSRLHHNKLLQMCINQYISYYNVSITNLVHGLLIECLYGHLNMI